MPGVHQYIDNIQSLVEYLPKTLEVEDICVFSYVPTNLTGEGEVRVL